MKFIVTLLLSIIIFSSCQEKQTPPKVESRDSDITADVLAKVASIHEYRSRRNNLTISSDGTYKLKFDAIVQKYSPGGIKTIVERDEARCLLDFSGKISFHKSAGVDAATPLLTLVKMTLTNTSVLESEATDSTRPGSEPSELCHYFQFAAFDQNTFDNYAISYDGMSVLFAGFFFNIKSKEQMSAKGFGYQYTATTFNEDSPDFDIIRSSYGHTYFIKSGGDINLTEMAFNDLKGKMKESRSEDSELSPIELNVALEKDLKTLTVTQKECHLNYVFYILNVRAKTDGVFIKLVGTHNSVFDSSNPHCVSINENIKRLGSETRISYANQTKSDSDPNNFLKFFIKQADNSFVTWTFGSR